jgi:hypothetical protein
MQGAGKVLLGFQFKGGPAQNSCLSSCCLVQVEFRVLLKVLMVLKSVQAGKMFDAPNQTAAECFSAIRTIAAFSMGPHASDMYKKQLQPPTAAIAKSAQVSGLGFAFSQGTMLMVRLPGELCPWASVIPVQWEVYLVNFYVIADGQNYCFIR